MPEYELTISRGASPSRTIRTDGSHTLLELLRESGFAIDAPCAGLGKCGKCRVTVSGLCRRENGELILLEGETLHACSVYPAGALKVELPLTAATQVLTEATTIPGGGHGLALAVDIGTTTVAAYLYDLATGKCLGSLGERNVQSIYGGDVISRIQYASRPEGLLSLRDGIRSQIRSMAEKLCGETDRIAYVSVAGNTVMEHLFAGLSPESIGLSPYAPLSLFGEEAAAGEYISGLGKNCLLYICPAISGFVGGDITAGLLGCGAAYSPEPVLFIDVGTNGEIALGGKDGFVCCSAAAGPAFEGGEIECGSPARTGAISSVSDDLSFSVIGGGEPLSICGSGLIDAAASLMRNDLLDDTGRLQKGRFDFGNGVYVSGRDIRQLQLAKAAVRGGIDTAVELSGLGYGDIAKVLIAGGFGAALNVKSACAIGLLPAALAERTSYVGNASGIGAAMALDSENRRALSALSRKCRYEELTVSDVFTEKYINSMMFGEPDED